MSVEIINRSDWPDWALDIIIPWIVKRAGINWNYRVIVRKTKKNIWAGRGGKYAQSIRVHRRYSPGRTSAGRIYTEVDPDKKEVLPKPKKFKWPYQIKEWRFKRLAHEFEIRSRLELLIFLLAHEAHHANGGNRENWRKNGRVDRVSMEHDCNEEGALAVKEFRQNWEYFRSKFQEKLRRIKKSKRKPTTVEKRDALYERRLALLNQWERKLKAAQNKVKKYSSLVRRYESKQKKLISVKS